MCTVILNGTLADVEKLLPQKGRALKISGFDYIVLDCVQSNCSAHVTLHLDDSSPFFEGHFPGNPVMPGYETIEATAQVCGLVSASGYQIQGQPVPGGVFVSAIPIKFKHPATVGDLIRIHVQQKKMRLPFGKFDCSVTVVKPSGEERPYMDPFEILICLA